MASKVYSRSFAGGEIAPEMLGQITDVRFQTGLRRCRNFVSLPHGPVRNRPGTRFCAEVKDSTKATRLIPFRFSNTQQLVVEMGEGYFRFYNNGALVTYASPLPLYEGPTVIPAAATSGPGNYFDLTNNWVHDATGHDFQTGDRLAILRDAIDVAKFHSTPDLFFWWPWAQVYCYAIRISANNFKLAVTYEDALAGIGVSITAAGSSASSSNIRIARAYAPGERVLFSNDYACREVPFGFVSQGVYTQRDPGSNPSLWLQLDGTHLEAANDYAEGDLFDVRFVQSNDIITLTHPDYPTIELRRESATVWTSSQVSFSPVLFAPQNPNVVATSAGESFRIIGWDSNGVTNTTTATARLQTDDHPGRFLNEGASVVISGITQTGSSQITPGEYIVTNFSFDNNGSPRKGHFDIWSVAHEPLQFNLTSISATVRATPLSVDTINHYRITAVDARGRESQASDEVSVDNNLFVNGSYNTLTWDPVTGADHYRVYKKVNGLYGLAAKVESDTLTWDDDAADIDTGITLPILDTSLTPSNRAGAVCYHQQRRVFAGTNIYPQSVWMTRVGTEADLSYTLPPRDDDALLFAVASTEASRIVHAVSARVLLLLTEAVEYIVRASQDGPLTPGDINVEPHSFVGSATVRPFVANNVVVHVANRGGHVRALQFDVASQTFGSGDLSVRAPHLFDGLTIQDAAFGKAPYPFGWFTSSSGDLLGMSFLPEQEVLGWHAHDTGGGDAFESVCVVSEGDEDIAYVVVNRTVDGSSVRYVERFAPMHRASLAASVFVDSALTFTSVSAGALSVPHLVGREVAILADGVVLANQTVSAGGTITVSASYSTVTVGLPIDARVQTLPLAMQVDGYGQGQKHNVSRVHLRVVDSCTFLAGPTEATAAPPPRSLLSTTPSDAVVPVAVPPSWDAEGSIYVRQTQPLPLTIVGMTFEVTSSG